MHPERCTVWCVFWAGVIGPHFIEDKNSRPLTMNGELYQDMMAFFLWLALVELETEGMDLEQMWFQQDGATCHTSRESMALLREKFPDNLISNRSDQNWPPRSCDLTQCDFFLWGYVKSQVHANNPQDIHQLKEIRRVIGRIGRDVSESNHQFQRSYYCM